MPGVTVEFVGDKAVLKGAVTKAKQVKDYANTGFCKSAF